MENLKAFIFFIIIVLLVYGTTNYYLYRRIMQAASLSGTAQVALMVLIWIAISAFPLGHALGEKFQISRIVTWIGAFWLAIMFYGVLIAVLIDLIRGIDMLTGWLPNWVINDRVQTGRLLLAVCGVGLLVLFTAGRIRTLYPVIREHRIEIKLPEGISEYNIAVISDVHLGVLVGPKQLNRIISMVNDLGADICLVDGDLIDESPTRLEWAIDPLKQLDAPDGVWAVTGNHEFYAGLGKAQRFIEDCGMMLLRNEMVEIPDKIRLVGLDDETGSRDIKSPFVPIKNILGGGDSVLPTVLMHHTPRRMKEAAGAGIDVMISGHTHAGQLWPTKYIVRAIFGVWQGLTTFRRPDGGMMSFFLMNGTGNWGPPMRIDATPDILHLILVDKK